MGKQASGHLEARKVVYLKYGLGEESSFSDSFNESEKQKNARYSCAPKRKKRLFENALF